MSKHPWSGLELASVCQILGSVAPVEMGNVTKIALAQYISPE